MPTHGIPLRGWRRIAAAIWNAPSDPQIYGTFEIDATNLLEFVRRGRELGHHLTPTHLAGRALGVALREVPSLNVRLVGGRAVPRGSIDVFFITSVDRGHDLTGVKISEIDAKPASEVARELDEASGRLKAGNDAGFTRAKQLMDRLPMPVLRLVLRVSAWLAGTHAVGLPLLGVSGTPFGSAMVSSVGMLGLPTGFTPLAWIYTVPVIVLLGEISDKPVAVHGQVQVRPVLPVTATIDHRYADGAELATALDVFREYLEDPAKFEPGPGRVAARERLHVVRAGGGRE